MNILSLFDGISGAQVAINNLGITDYTYYASEIDKYAIQITQKNYPNTVQLGDTNSIDFTQFKDIDLLIGGSPCQDLSIVKQGRQGLKGSRSGLFWKYVEALETVNPKYFVLENVASMRYEDKTIISDALNCEPLNINSSLVTAQMRNRYYWTNINSHTGMLGQIVSEIPQPVDKGIYLKDILLDDAYTADMKSYCIPSTYGRACLDDYKKNKRQLVLIGHTGNSNSQGNRVYSPEGKSVSLSSNGGGMGAKTRLYKVADKYRKLHPIECERLQGFPDNYTNCVSNTQRYRALGNSFTVPVIEYILSYMTIRKSKEEK